MAKIKTRDKIKIAAQKLFAERGIDSVSVREIVRAAEQKNMASLHYYFRTKDDLAREVLADASNAIEVQRFRLLDEIEAKGGAQSPKEILEVFIKCAVIRNDDPRSLSNVRLFVLAFRDNRDFVLEALEDYESSAYLRCLEQLRGFMSHMDGALVEQRLYLMQMYVFTALAVRERALSEEIEESAIWQQESMVDEVMKTAEALLFA